MTDTSFRCVRVINELQATNYYCFNFFVVYGQDHCCCLMDAIAPGGADTLLTQITRDNPSKPD